MPGFVTHYIFGREAFRDIRCVCPRDTRILKRNLFTNHSVYSLGQQGPDLFFYYPLSYVPQGHNLGTLAHTRKTGAFFHGLMKCALSFADSCDRDIAESYLCGFLGHYILDTICHPYIYAMTHYTEKCHSYFYRHAYLETDIDTSLLSIKLQRMPFAFRPADTIFLSRKQKMVVAKLLQAAFCHAYPNLRINESTMLLAIASLRLAQRMLQDDTGQKKAMMRLAERLLPGYPVVSPLFPSNDLFFHTDPFNLRRARWKNPWDKKSSSQETFFELYDKAEAIYLSRLAELCAIFHSEWDPEERSSRIRAFLAEYGNRSFHSGLECSIPD